MDLTETVVKETKTIMKKARDRLKPEVYDLGYNNLN
jgi:hypothetical protein